MNNHEKAARDIEGLFHRGQYPQDLELIKNILRKHYPAPTPSMEVIGLITRLRAGHWAGINWEWIHDDSTAASLLQAEFDKRARGIIEITFSLLKRDGSVVTGADRAYTKKQFLDAILAEIGGK